MAAVAVTSKLNISISSPFHMAAHQGKDVPPNRAAAASSSRLQPSSSQLSTPAPPETQPKTFKRFRTSLQQSIRTATKSKAANADGSAEEHGVVINGGQGKGKERASEDQILTKEKSKSSKMLSKVSFRRTAGRESVSPSPVPPPPLTVEDDRTRKVERDRDKQKVRQAGFTSFETPSLRQASMSSPALHLSSQAFPSPYSQPFALPAASSSNVSALVSPTRDRSKKLNGQPSSPKDISGPLPLTPKRDSRSNGKLKGLQISVPLPQSGRNSESTNEVPTSPETPRRAREASRSPDLSPPSPTPPSKSGSSVYKRATASTSHLPLGSPPGSPTTRAVSPIRARSSSRTPGSSRPGPSASSSHLPLTPPASPSPTPFARRPSVDNARRPSIDVARRPSFDTARRPSIEARRPSLDTARRPSIEARRPSLDTQRQSPIPSRAASPTTPIRTRAVSPTQRNYSPNLAQPRFYNINASTTSLSAGASAYTSPEHRELIRTASSIIIRDMLKPPSQVRESHMDQKQYEEVELRLRALARLERVWGKSGINGSTTQLNSMSSSGLSAGGEDRERRHFCEALRDGYVLCQFINKLHPGSIARVDKREDGFVRTSNVTKFLAASSSLGVQPDDLFNRDDLIEASPDCLVRVAKNIIALSQLLESPVPEKSKYIQGGQSPSPYGHGTGSRAAASTPNLHTAQRSMSPTGIPSPGRRRMSPPISTLPPVRSDSPNESEGSSGGNTARAGGPSNTVSDAERDEVPPMVPQRSPLRNRPSVDRTSIADSTRANVGDSVRGSIAESFVPSVNTRQSLASTSVTETSAFSSLLDVQRSSSMSGQHNKFGTIRTFTTEATSLAPSDTPSVFRAEASSIPSSPTEDLPRKRVLDSSGNVSKPFRDRRPSETAMVDLSRVEEADESGASANGKFRQAEKERTKLSNIRLGKGKWPDDFLDAFQSPKNATFLDDDDSPASSTHTPLSISPPRKLAIVGANRANESLDSLPQFPRRPTHRARHSVDTAGLRPRETSPDGSVSPTPRIMIRRNSSRTGAHRNGVYIPRNADEPRSSDDDLVPFPRTVSGEHGTPPSQGIHFPGPVLDLAKSAPSAGVPDRPRQPRGRFQSEIDGSSSRRKQRPNSYDEMGAKPRRTRFESMVNLGGPSSNASASDLLNRDSYEGSTVRQTLVVKEDGKAPTQFQLGNCIGRGQFGAVYRALNLNTGQMVAVKRIRLEGLKEEEIAQLMKEVDLVKSLSHPSIVKYEGMARDDNTLNIILEYAENGSLGQTLKAFGKLNERLVAGYVVKILEGLHYLHQSDVVHCDLKAANILTTKNGNVKLSDFGVSLNLRAMEREMKDVAGTPNWMAPEVIELKGASTKSDIWSLACTVIELLTGRPPYGDIPNSMSVMFRIVEDDMPPLPEGCSRLLRDFLIQCFNKDPTKRPDAETLCEHEWLKQNWAPHKDLRPQDSIPFLRRVSADMQKSEAIRYLAQIEMPDPNRSTPEHRQRLDSATPSSPPRRRLSNDPDSISPREHSFVKTTFGKPVICRVCLHSVKKSAVLCEQCSLIAHTKCAPNAPPTCDLRAQLLLYAQYAENGAPNSPYSNPMEILAAAQSATPSTPISDGGFSSKPSLDVPPSSPTPSSNPSSPHPPTAFKVFAAFKRSRSLLSTHESDPNHSSSTLANSKAVSRKRSVLKRNPMSKERPPSIASNSTSPHSASMRSAITATDSLSSRPDTVRQSTASVAETECISTAGTERDDGRSIAIPGDMPRDQRKRDRESKSSNNSCLVQ
ncbi:unnamed protein product [Somion occarium]|uniref:Uncharacterized protein n=1 Tax=Somion occarium TaxID=3059160 RepID=A0ABP1E4U3_9APHY